MLNHEMPAGLFREWADDPPRHRCAPGWDSEKSENIFPSGGAWGAAIEECREDVWGQLWVANSEYATRVNHCPFCGHRAKSQVEWSG